MVIGVRVKFIDDYDAYIITDKVNSFLESIERDSEIISIEYTTASLPTVAYYCVMIKYRPFVV
jgi:hypothetical protein